MIVFITFECFTSYNTGKSRFLEGSFQFSNPNAVRSTFDVQCSTSPLISSWISCHPRIHLPLLAVAASLLIPSCLEKQAKTAETQASTAALEAEKTALTTQLAALTAELDSSKAALAEATAKVAKAEADAKAAGPKAEEASKAKLAEAQKLMEELRTTMDKREAEHQEEIKDLNRQIKAMALEVPASGGGPRPVAPDGKTDRPKVSPDRHIAPR
jgi:hypothetical protein